MLRHVNPLPETQEYLDTHIAECRYEKAISDSVPPNADVAFKRKIERILRFSRDNKWFDPKFVLKMNSEYHEKGHLESYKIKAINSIIEKLEIPE